MAQLKDTTITGDLLVSGKINNVTEKHIGNIETVCTTAEINPNTLNEEVTLCTIPTGYIGILCHPRLIPAAAAVALALYSTPSASQVATLTFYRTELGKSVESTQTETLSPASELAAVSMSPWLKGGTTLRCKVTTAGVGYSCKVLLQANVILQKV